MMSLNIKNEKTHRRVRELARLTGESMTAAVDKAVQERLERVGRSKQGSLAQRLLQIARECAPLWKEPYKSMEHGDLLYDEKGLPK
jgi:antitoxin VapB